MRLRLEGIGKRFGETAVLSDVSLSLGSGEVHALLGHNGAGKSTLMRIVLGLETATAGRMTLDDAPYAPSSARAARALGVVMVPQERTACGHLTVAENILLGHEPTRFGVISPRERDARASRALAFAAGDAHRIALGARVRDLSVAEVQLVEIARALAQAGIDHDGVTRARLLVLDEPTSSLAKDDAHRLFANVRKMASGGLSVILVTHFLNDVPRHADRYTVLRDGAVVARGDARAVTPDALVKALLGESAGATERAVSNATAGKTLLAHGGFAVRGGEIVGIAGLVGSGRSRLLRELLTAQGAPRIGLLSEDRGGEGLMLDRSIADNIVLSPRGARWLPPGKANAAAARWLDELAIRAKGPDQRVRDLSGGNQQKVQLARLLREDFDLLLVDEPTRGIDLSSKRQVLALFGELASRGKAIVLVSSQFDELLAVCHRIAVLRRGVLGEFRSAEDWNEEALLLEAAS
ncbi:MAG: sugar ABC transporter ATP-binding protein [Myxococcales bacterium]|nr:sugar ABC transporter ATP-binding protein [Myxococcales bacterium]